MENLNHFLAKQKQAIVHEFTENMGDCLVATTPEKLNMHSQLYGWELNPLPGTSKKSVLVVRKRKGAFPELWVRWNYTNYRKAFSIYLQKVHGLDSNSIPIEFQVDHLEATSRFHPDHPTYFIRVCLLDRKINASYGASFEKAFNKTEQKHRPNGGFHMSWMAFLKAYGIFLPSKTASEATWKSWADATARRLEKENIGSYDLTYFGILGVLRLGFTGYYAGSGGGEYNFPMAENSAGINPQLNHSAHERATDENFQYEFRCIDGIGHVTFKSDEPGAEKFDLPPRRDLDRNYPGTFSWGYSGSGPYFLTVSLLAHHFKHDKFASRHINRLLDQFISKIRFHPVMGPFFLATSEISKFLQDS